MVNVSGMAIHADLAVLLEIVLKLTPGGFVRIATVTGLTIDAETHLVGAVTLGTGIPAVIGAVTGSTIGVVTVLTMLGAATLAEVAMLARERAALLTEVLVAAPWCATILISLLLTLAKEVDCALGTGAPEDALLLLVVDWIIQVKENAKMQVPVPGIAIGDLVPNPL